MTNASRRAHLIGIIILARFLELPLTRYEAMIEKVEDSPLLTQLRPDIISTRMFPKAQVLEPARFLGPNCLGQLQGDEGGFRMSYRYDGLAAEYLINEEGLKHWMQHQVLSAEDKARILALKRRLRLINTRNRLTHMILMGLAEHQEAYLSSGDVLHLRPLSQVALAEWINSEVEGSSRFLPPGSGLEFVDHSMISRLTVRMSVLSPQLQEVALRDLLPSTRDVHKRLIEAILHEEEERIRRGQMQKAYTDEEIKRRLEARFGIFISRRTVSACRQYMRIPSSLTRNSQLTYPPRDVRFSFYYPLNAASVRINAPEAPGVYEISLAEGEIEYPLGSSGVVYLGSAKNIRKRLRDHLRPNSKNGGLRSLLDDHRAAFRYVIRWGEVRAQEKRLCHCFTMAYGALPCCNRIRP